MLTGATSKTRDHARSAGELRAALGSRPEQVRSASAAHGDERTLLELAYLLESEQPFPRIQD